MKFYLGNNRNILNCGIALFIIFSFMTSGCSVLKQTPPAGDTGKEAQMVKAGEENDMENEPADKTEDEKKPSFKKRIPPKSFSRFFKNKTDEFDRTPAPRDNNAFINDPDATDMTEEEDTLDGSGESSIKNEDLVHIADANDDPFDITRNAPKPLPNDDDGQTVHLEIAFDNADIYEVLDLTLYELYNVNYMIDPSIRGKVTFHLTGDYSRNEFINILNNILQLNNLSITRGPGNLFKIVRRGNTDNSLNTPVSVEPAKSDAGDVTRMIRLRYVSAGTASKSIRNFLSKGAKIISDDYLNSLVVTDTLDNIEKVAALVAIMDVPSFKGVSWRFYPLVEAEAEKVAGDLNKIFKKNGVFIRNGLDGGLFEIIPIKSINSILVVTRDTFLLNLIEDWVNVFDSIESDETGTNVYVYFVENGTASELADILRQIYGGNTSSTKKKEKTTIVAPTAGEEKDNKKEGQQQKKQVYTGELSGEIEIIADETNNAIVFKASKRDYKIIQGVLKKLDIVPRQVLINVVVAEITLSGSLEYGVEWFLQENKGRYAGDDTAENGKVPLLGMPMSLNMNKSSGLAFKINDAGNFLKGLVSLLGSDSDVNILSSPSILAVDNKESTIEVGEEIPTVTGTLTNSDSATSQTVQYKNTAILLTVTPHINSRGLVKLELSQEVSKIGEKYEIGEIENYSFLNRKAETSLVIEDGQTVIMAGLMETTKSNTDTGVPYLRNIPILGYLFKSISDETRKTELVIMITPKVVNNEREADQVSAEFIEKVERVKEFIEDKEKKK